MELWNLHTTKVAGFPHSPKGKHLKRTRASLQQADPCRYSPRAADGRSSRHSLYLSFAWLSSILRTKFSRCHRPEARVLYLQPKEWFLSPVAGSTCFLGNGGLRDTPAGSAVYQNPKHAGRDCPEAFIFMISSACILTNCPNSCRHFSLSGFSGVPMQDWRNAL